MKPEPKTELGIKLTAIRDDLSHCTSRLYTKRPIVWGALSTLLTAIDAVVSLSETFDLGEN